MRVALCLSGQARGIHLTWPDFKKNIIDKYNADVFMSFANDSSLTHLFETEDLGFTELELIKDPSLEYLESITRGDTPCIQHLASMGKECTNLAVLRQYYFINRVNELKKEYEAKNGFKYDWVIRSRADIHILSTLGNLSKMDNDVVIIPRSHNGGALNDFFAYSSSENMDKYSNRIKDVKKIPDDLYPFFNPHVELAYILKKLHKLKVATADIKLKRERSWRGGSSQNVFLYYGEHGVEEYNRRKKENYKGR